MSGQRLEPDREAESDLSVLMGIRADQLNPGLFDPAKAKAGISGCDAVYLHDSESAYFGMRKWAGTLLAELDAVRESLALVEGQAHRATEDVLALRRIATAAKAYRDAQSTRPARGTYLAQLQRVADAAQALDAALAGWGDATRGAKDER